MRSFVCTGLVVLGVASEVALAQSELPPPQIVELVLREVPTDPESAVRFRIYLNLLPVERDGAWVGWQIDQVEFRKPRLNDSDVVWLQVLPFVPTADGLWWTEHVDPLAPTALEFVLVPWLVGTADSLDPSYADLEFDLAGHEYTATPPSTRYAATTGLNYTLRCTSVAAGPPVDDSNDDEPVEIPDPPTDPSGMTQ